MRHTTSARLLFLSALAVPALAWAHPGHGGLEADGGFVAGALHPFTGLDHLLAIVAAGVLLAWLPQRSRWFVCAAFLGLSGATHALWLPAAADGFIAGLLSISAVLVGAGMAVVACARRAFRPPHG